MTYYKAFSCRRTLLITLLLTLLNLFVNGDIVVNTDSGPIKGKSLTPKKIEAFLGIPYAEPPIGSLRFAKPVAKSPWKEMLNANELPSACVQAVVGLLAVDPSKMSEDCLYLNLWVPENSGNLKPIMIFIHGGAFMIGSTNIRIYDGANLSERGDVIVATINYRVGSLGFFSGFIEEAPGNMGMYDQLMAIQWIKNNAKHFGGDPDNITIFGQSAGAFSVSMHMISPLSKNLFKRAILQSGSSIHPMYSNDNKVLFIGSQTIARLLGCAEDEKDLKTNPKAVIDCMKSLPSKKFSDTDLTFFQNAGILIPRVGDEFLPNTPIDSYRKGEFENTEILIGINRDEGPSFLTLQRPNLFGRFGEKANAASFDEISAKQLLQSLIKMDEINDIIQSYLNRVEKELRYTYLNAMSDVLGDFLITCGAVYQADHQALQDNPVYFYLFDYRSAASHRAEWMGVSHFDEIPYVFGNPLMKNFTAFEEELSKDIMGMWTTFARTGNPNIPGGLKWPRYTHEDPKYFIISRRDRVGIRPDNYRCDKWRNLFRSEVDS